MASLDDMLTTHKNGVVAINNLHQGNTRSEGTNTSSTVTASTLIISGKGRLVNFSVVVPGSTVGAIYNSLSVSGVTAPNQLVSVPNVNGVYVCGQIFTNGLVIIPGTGQSINVTYSLG